MFLVPGQSSLNREIHEIEVRKMEVRLYCILSLCSLHLRLWVERNPLNKLDVPCKSLPTPDLEDSNIQLRLTKLIVTKGTELCRSFGCIFEHYSGDSAISIVPPGGGQDGFHLSSLTTNLSEGLSARQIYGLCLCRTDVIHLQTSMSSRFKPGYSGKHH
ncbi:hypothetical protein TNCV_2159641 [Trichonephila clavipes]|nr:hypothetical protein TNCV_2159641 [Trichonephila clavipes]